MSQWPAGLTRETGNLKADFFRKTIDELSRDLIYLIFYFQGEPYINPQFLEMVRYAHQQKLYTITSTNGHFLDDQRAGETVESGLDRLIISVDGTTQETYEQYRKEGELATVLEGLEMWSNGKGVEQCHPAYHLFNSWWCAPTSTRSRRSTGWRRRSV